MRNIVCERPHLKASFELVDRKGMECVWAGQFGHETFIVFEKDGRGESMNYRCFRGKQAEAEVCLLNIEDTVAPTDRPNSRPSIPTHEQAPQFLRSKGRPAVELYPTGPRGHRPTGFG